MSRSRVGEKRARDNEALEFIPGLTLSQHPPGQRKHLFMKKLKSYTVSKSLHPTEFEGYRIRERFERMGWEQLLSFSCDKIYKRPVIQWMASLSRNGDELTGKFGGKSYTITPIAIRDLLGVDTRTNIRYARLDFGTTSDENKRWLEACKTVFGLEENAKKISKMTPLVKVLWRIGVWTFHSRYISEHDCEIHPREIYLLHALFTGDYLYSFAHLMIDNIWDMYEHQHRIAIPHAYYISEILKQLGAVSEDVYVIPPLHRVITRSSFSNIKFSESETEYIIDDQVTVQRVSFSKVPLPNIPTQMNLPNPHLDMTHLLTNLQNQHNNMMIMVINIQKRLDRQALEAERREQERERQADIRAHAIIWDIERQRYFYEQEQEQLHKAWNKAYGSDEFQFPQISHTSFHPPQAGSRYYDPSQGNEIPKAFQDLFGDIYGTRR